MSAKNTKVLKSVSGWNFVHLVVKCFFIGLWQLIHFSARRLWKGHRRKSNNSPPVELTIDSSIGIHCYIKLMGVKYHYVETGPKAGQTVLILGDAPDAGKLWVPSWSAVVRRLAESGYHVITLDLRGTGGSEGGYRRDLSPPNAVEEITALLESLGVSSKNPAIVIGFGIGGMLTWYLAHCREAIISKFAVIGAPHPNLYWQYPPTEFCQRALYFIQWPYFPERWLAEGLLHGSGAKVASSRARDWSGAVNYVRGAAWWRVCENRKVTAPALLMGTRSSAAQLVASAQYCTNPALRLLTKTDPGDRDLPGIILEFLVKDADEPKAAADAPRGLVGRMLEAVADRGRGLTARLSLPVLSAQA